jgi:sporulation protein YlmC with PRC-barrel domain
MLLLVNKLINRPVLSLRTGGQVAVTYGCIISPDNLKIEGLYCHDRASKQNLILLYQDIRNIIDQGIIVNDHDVLSTPDVLVRLQDILKLNFSLIGKQVVTISKQKVGKVKDFALDSETFYIQKLYIGQSVIKSLSTGQLSVDRTQIVEVTDAKIVIQEILKTSKLTSPAAATSSLSSST